MREPAALASFPRATLVALALAALVTLPGCATFRKVAALRQVDFSLAGVSDGMLAGIPIQSSKSLDDLSAMELIRIGAALTKGELPLEGVILLEAFNPAGNVQAQLLGMDWTLFLDGRETVRGGLDREHLLPPGESITVPVQVELDLLEFFDDQLEEVVALALAMAGAGEPQRVLLEATPSIQTPFGPIRYPEPIRIEHEVSGLAGQALAPLMPTLFSWSQG